MQIQGPDDPNYGRVLNRLRIGKGDNLSSEKKRHTCTHEVCAPQSEDQMVHSNLLDGPAISNNVYLCNYGCVHICSESSCGLYEHTYTQTCPISGIQWGNITSSYSRGNGRTWYVHPSEHTSTKMVRSETKHHIDDVTGVTRKKKKKRERTLPTSPPLGGKKEKKPRKKGLSESIVKERTRDMVILLLYSDSRKDRNNAAILDRIESAEKSKQTYIEQRRERHQLPYLYDLIRIRAVFTSKPLPYEMYEMDLSLVEYYTCVVYQAWEYVIAYMEANEEIMSMRPDIKVVTLGVLYLMRGGHKINGIEILPADDFLQTSLPLVNDLTYFEVPKKNVTRGVQLVTDAYKHQITVQKRQAEDLILDVSRLPRKGVSNGLTKLTSRR